MTPRSPRSVAGEEVRSKVGLPPVTAGRRAFFLTFSITQRDVVPSAEPDADRKPCAVWLA
jgi:hypothetical protein